MPKPVVLTTDLVLYVLLGAIALYTWHALRTPTLRLTWRTVARDSAAMSAAVVLCVFFFISMLDSVHFRPMLPPAPGASADAAPAYAPRTLSLIDVLLQARRESVEKTYSVPLGTHQYSKETMVIGGKTVRDYPRLRFGGAHLKDTEGQWQRDVTMRSLLGLGLGALSATLLWILVAGLRAVRVHGTLRMSLRAIQTRTTDIPWRAMLRTASVLLIVFGWIAALWPYYHVFGTDQTGNDVLFQAIKSIRTAIVIGSIATLATLPFAIVFGILAGYYKGRVDDAIQYLYTVLSSIPSVLLIAAFVLMIQVYVDKSPQVFETGLERADIRLFLLSVILGVTGWATLARLLRAEALKLTELDFVQAARAFGVSDLGIMRRHILPNVMHIVLIVTVLDFSGLVLLEAVLSYVGVGVDPTTNSFGTMINSARTELSRDPAVWWNLLAAFFVMVTLVLSLQLFASTVREAFDPRARAFRVHRPRAVPHGTT
ncbi:MAG TPA: ABC transporter permease [Burkholderiaceae bacterium]|nr:ABC transporter permease [Burkholderiaceae bacterium]